MFKPVVKLTHAAASAIPPISTVAATAISSIFLLSACQTPVIPPSSFHIQAPAPTTSNANIPATVQRSSALAAPKASSRPETYSVSVYKVPVQSLLFALARDAKLNVDIHPGITGEVTLNALDQTLPQLLSRVSKQVDMRFELDGNNLMAMPDTPFLRNYKIDYVNVSRNTTSNVSIATQISSGAQGNGNTSTTSVNNTSNNHFWETLVQNIKDTLRETDKLVLEASATAPAPGAAPNAQPPANPIAAAGLVGNVTTVLGATNGNTAANGANNAAGNTGNNTAGASNLNNLLTNTNVPTYREAASVIANPETGLIAVRATSRQHDKIAEFLDLVQTAAKKQVLIEATIIEVKLSEQYQQGINWSRVANSRSSGPSFTQGQIGGSTLPSGVAPGTTPGIFLLNYLNPTSALGDLTATLQLLDTFGKVKVLSSPKISVLNNQTAILKVVDNNVYFTITASIVQGVNGASSFSTYSSTLNTVPVGLVMTVTPQIADSNEITLNVRPTITRIVGYVQDPNPVLADSKVTSKVPVVQAREMESVLKVTNGQVAVMGGLMQDSIDNQRDTVPGLSNIPLIGNLFGYRNETTSKTELVIFLRPVVINEASLQGDFREFRRLLPGENQPAKSSKSREVKADGVL